MRHFKYSLFTVLLILTYSCAGDDAREPILIEDAYSSDLFFSEYIEGTSFNKALEIVNLTGESIDLEAQQYSIKKQANAAGDWMGEYFLTGNLENNDVLVIANEQATEAEIINRAHYLKTGAPMDFNGNDPVGLFRNGVLIDVIGETDNPEDFAKDVTLRRRTEVTEPSTIFNPAEWEVFEVGTIEDLGRY